jgi:prepilin-type N-terminal cleavage/methylation domain-containing protein
MSRRGFTVIEALVAIALLAILAQAGATMMTSLAAAVRVGAATRTLAQTMRETRARAMAEGDALEIVFDATAGRWTLRDATGAIRRVEPLPAPVGFQSVPARARIRFTSTGAAENGTVVLAAGTASASIVVNQRGRVRLG